jgi:hypothetical protein
MQVSALIRSTLVGIAGISLAVSSGCTCPDDTEFDLEEDVTEHILARVVGETGDPDAVACEAVCQETVGGPFLFVTVSSCELELGDVDLPPRRKTDEDERLDPRVVGTVRCAGTQRYECIGGRRPLGHVEARAASDDALGRSFAELAHVEAASVVAFLQLAKQLTAWGAPELLIRRCRAAARDETVHAELMARFARARGTEIPAVRCSPSPGDFLAAAMHNAREGCVNEAWAALLAHVQAARAADPAMREAFARIAADETRHAQLAWDLDAWFRSRLGVADRHRVVDARMRAIAELSEIARAQAHAFPAELGLPPEQLLTRMADDFGARLEAA